MSISRISTVRRNRDVLHHPLDESLVMADLASGHYFGLQGTGRRIWELIDQPISVPALCESMQREYEIDTDICEQEVLAFLGELQRDNLLVVD